MAFSQSVMAVLMMPMTGVDAAHDQTSDEDTAQRVNQHRADAVQLAGNFSVIFLRNCTM